ncbi:unnamed protein product [Rotaria sp. Silwood1]|nr:unnamed protein product [Rotaria sp. Silwood1]CAF1568467.1 unnamed protein product [Rotaria sp. Silwood1]CAF3605974.1 unnamed protein product [Rotaria sp. Silwood1]CAF3627885.1 unnamed protein product [Rotaria sp. Silwood1]CAF3631264.1 unnamed protein product [Rotaria sp. Silwood1]
MSTSILKSTKYSNSLPDDIFNYNQNEFYEFIKETRGADVAELFSFQAIRHATHLIDTTCDEILSILEEDSKDINNLKKLCCFQLNQTRTTTTTTKEKKRSAQQRTSSSVKVKSLVNDTLSEDEIVSLEAIPVSPVVVDTSSTQPKKNGKENSLVDNRNSTTTQSNTANSLSNTRSKKSKTSQRTSSKRFRSPSTETSSDTETTANKKNRSLSSNSTNSSPEKRALDDNKN